MLIKVLAFASFREILGKERKLDVNEGVTVKGVLAILASSCTGFKVAAFEDSDELMDYVLLMINNKRIDPQVIYQYHCMSVMSWPYFLLWQEDRSF